MMERGFSGGRGGRGGGRGGEDSGRGGYHEGPARSRGGPMPSIRDLSPADVKKILPLFKGAKFKVTHRYVAT